MDAHYAKDKRWRDINTLMGPEDRHTIACALKLAAEQYRKDMLATHMPHSDRVSEAFHQQAIDCENIAERIEL